MSPGWRESSAEHRVPDLGRGAALSAQAAERELVISNSKPELNTSDRDCRILEDLEAEHRAGARLHASMVLLDHVVQVLRRPQLDSLPAGAFKRKLAHRAVRRSIAVERDAYGRPTLRVASALREDALAAATSRLGLSRKSTVCPRDRRPDTGKSMHRGLDVGLIDPPRPPCLT